MKVQIANYIYIIDTESNKVIAQCNDRTTAELIRDSINEPNEFKEKAKIEMRKKAYEDAYNDSIKEIEEKYKEELQETVNVNLREFARELKKTMGNIIGKRMWVKK
jgi:hypothetical protein